MRAVESLVDGSLEETREHRANTGSSWGNATNSARIDQTRYSSPSLPWKKTIRLPSSCLLYQLPARCELNSIGKGEWYREGKGREV